MGWGRICATSQKGRQEPEITELLVPEHPLHTKAQKPVMDHGETEANFCESLNATEYITYHLSHCIGLLRLP